MVTSDTPVNLEFFQHNRVVMNEFRKRTPRDLGAAVRRLDKRRDLKFDEIRFSFILDQQEKRYQRERLLTYAIFGSILIAFFLWFHR